MTPDGKEVIELDTTSTVARGGVAFVPGKSTVVAVLEEKSALRVVRLHDVFAAAPPSRSRRRTGAPVGDRLTLPGRLRFGDGAQPGARELTVTRSINDGTPVSLPTVTTYLDGRFTIEDTPQVLGPTEYVVRWAGDDG